jgi:hypothetical protein
MNIQMGVLRPERSKIELYDILGNMIYSILLNGSAKIDVSDVPKGFYIMKLTKGKKTFMYKIVKK